MASIDRTAYPRFKRVVSGRELAESFTPSAEELAGARTRTQSDQHFLTLLVWLKSYQRLGYFPKLADVPDAVAGHVSVAAGLGADSVVAEHDSQRTAKWHRQQIREYLGVVYAPARVRAVAAAAIRAAPQTKDNPADLINVAFGGAGAPVVRAVRLHDPGCDDRDHPRRVQRWLLHGGGRADQPGLPSPVGPVAAGGSGDAAQRVRPAERPREEGELGQVPAAPGTSGRPGRARCDRAMARRDPVEQGRALRGGRRE